MENKYLNEERYQRGKKKLVLISLIILILGIILGSGLILMGIEKKNVVKMESQTRLTEIEKEKSELNAQITTKNYECDSLNMMDPNWYSDVNKCNSESMELTKKLNDLKSEEFDLKNNDGEAFILLCVLGGMIILAGCGISFGIFMFTKRREIMAFSAQQVMPVAKEGIEKMAPTVGNAVGSIGKELAKGISEGIKEAKEDEEENN